MLQRLADSLPPQFLLVLSRGLQSLSAPIVALLVATAGTLGEKAETAISLCNVLFVGNLCASFVVLGFFGPRGIKDSLRSLPRRARWEMLVFASLAALLSSMIFTALETTTVTNAVLLSRIGPVLYAVASAVLFGQALGKAEWAGFGLIGLGVLGTVFSGSGFRVVEGDWLILGSAFVYAVVTAMSKRLLAHIGLPGLVFARNFFSAIVFFILANIIFDPGHFADAFYGPLWVIMVVYALFVIVAAQFAWFRSISVLTPATIAKWTVVTPVLAMAYAFLINGETPGQTQLIALSFVTLGILVSNVGKFTPKGVSDNAEGSVSAS